MSAERVVRLWVAGVLFAFGAFIVVVCGSRTSVASLPGWATALLLVMGAVFVLTAVGVAVGSGQGRPEDDEELT